VIIAIEKGALGERAFNEAFAAWGSRGRASRYHCPASLRLINRYSPIMLKNTIKSISSATVYRLWSRSSVCLASYPLLS
jgi:hypothetical protein